MKVYAVIITVSPPPDDTTHIASGIRPVNLRTDLGPLADLIELVFRESMDENGRQAIREMRYLSKLGAGLGFISRINDLALGISMGYVWIEDGRLVGNVSIYPASWPGSRGEAWIVANVGVHPDYQRRGIAKRLMQASLDGIRRKDGKQAILQVDYQNDAAINLYEALGFARERAFTTWDRSSLVGAPQALHRDDVFITRRRSSEWRAEYALAQQVRSAERGGVGWLKPLHPELFHRTLWQHLSDLFAFSGVERLIIRSDDERRILASLWLESGIGLSRTRMTLLTDAAQGTYYAESLLNNVLRRLHHTPLSIEHPQDDEPISELLRGYRFRVKRTVWHMRYAL